MNMDCERLFLRFKRTPMNTFPKNGLAGKLQPWINDLIEVLTLNNVKVNPLKTFFFPVCCIWMFELNVEYLRYDI